MFQGTHAQTHAQPPSVLGVAFTPACAPLQLPNARVHVYRTPDLTSTLERVLRPPFNEVVGLQHTKIYVMDDTVILSGYGASCGFEMVVRWL